MRSLEVFLTFRNTSQNSISDHKMSLNASESHSQRLCRTRSAVAVVFWGVTVWSVKTAKWRFAARKSAQFVVFSYVRHSKWSDQRFRLNLNQMTSIIKVKFVNFVEKVAILPASAARSIVRAVVTWQSKSECARDAQSEVFRIWVHWDSREQCEINGCSSFLVYIIFQCCHCIFIFAVLTSSAEHWIQGVNNSS